MTGKAASTWHSSGICFSVGVTRNAAVLVDKHSHHRASECRGNAANYRPYWSTEEGRVIHTRARMGLMEAMSHDPDVVFIDSSNRSASDCHAECYRCGAATHQQYMENAPTHLRQ